MSPAAPLFVLAAVALGWRAPEHSLAAVGLLGLGLATPSGRGGRGVVAAALAGVGLVTLARSTSLWAWLLAFELMSLGLERAGLTGDKPREVKFIDYVSSLCFLTSFSLHQTLYFAPLSAGLFTLGLGLRLGVTLATSPPPAALGLTPIWGLVAVSAARGPLGLSAEAVAPWAALALLAPALVAIRGGRLAPAMALGALGLGVAASFTLPDPSWRLPWALSALATGPLLAAGPLRRVGHAWAAGASPSLLIVLSVLQAWAGLGLGGLGGLLILPNLTLLSAPPPADEPTSPPWLGATLALAALVAAWGLV